MREDSGFLAARLVVPSVVGGWLFGVGFAARGLVRDEDLRLRAVAFCCRPSVYTMINTSYFKKGLGPRFILALRLLYLRSEELHTSAFCLARFFHLVVSGLVPDAEGVAKPQAGGWRAGVCLLESTEKEQAS